MWVLYSTWSQKRNQTHWTSWYISTTKSIRGEKTCCTSIHSIVRSHARKGGWDWLGGGEGRERGPITNTHSTPSHSLTHSLSLSHTHTHTPSTQNFSVLIYALGTPGTPRKSSRCSDYLDAPAQHSTLDPPTLDFPSLPVVLKPHIAAPRISSPASISSAIKL